MKNNIALVDGQNLYQGIKGDGWHLDTKKFRQHLKDKYGVRKAYYYFGVRDPHLKNLYSSLRKSGFILKFKEHHKTAKSQKKGNVDTLIVFEVMKKLLDEADTFEKVVLVSGDGDYKNLVDYLIGKDRFEKILLPSRKSSSFLYESLTNKHYVSMEKIRNQVEHTRE